MVVRSIWKQEESTGWNYTECPICGSLDLDEPSACELCGELYSPFEKRSVCVKCDMELGHIANIAIESVYDLTAWRRDNLLPDRTQAIEILIDKLESI